MADKGGQQCPQGLTCPLCLESFKNPTLLRCGHTFCKVCLENYDQLHNGIDHMECPVCRKRTKLEANRVAGLSPNFSLQGLQDELHLDEHLLPNFCVLHKSESRNIFCEVCENFICITCFIKDHQGHKIVRKEDLREELKKKKTALIQESKTRKPQIEKILKDAEQKKEEVHCHLCNMEREIRDTFAKKVNALQENENKLIKKMHIMQRDSDKQSESFLAHQRQLIDDIDVSVGILEHTLSEHSKDHDLIEHHLRCIVLENSLKKPKNELSMTQVQEAMNSRFYCSSEKLLRLGCIKQGGIVATDISQQVKKTVASTKGRKGQGGTATTSNGQQVKKTIVSTKGQVGQEGTATTSIGQQVKKTVWSTKGRKGQGGTATTSNGQQVKKTIASTKGQVGQEGTATTSIGQPVKKTVASTKGQVGQEGTATTSNGQQVKKTVASTKGRVGQERTATTSNGQQVKKSVASTKVRIGQGGTATRSNGEQAKKPFVSTNVLIGQGGSAKRSIEQVEIAASVNTSAGEMQASTSTYVGGIPAPAVKNNSLIIVKEGEHSYDMLGMAALSENSVVVGYGGSGSRCFSVSGENRPYYPNGEVRDVYDIACLTDGRSAVLGYDRVCRVYDRQGTYTGLQYLCNQGSGNRRFMPYPQLCSDQDDNIYIVDRNPEILIFNRNNPNPQRVIDTGASRPYQICVTKTGAMIACSHDPGKLVHIRRSLAVLDKEGHIGSCIKSNNVVNEFMFAAVDSRDRVLIARVRNRTDVLRLTRYTLEGLTLTKEVMFKQLKLPHTIECSWCFVVSLNPNMIAFSTSQHLYFIELAV